MTDNQADFGGVDTGAAYLFLLAPNGSAIGGAVLAANTSAVLAPGFVPLSNGFTDVEYLTEGPLEFATVNTALALVHGAVNGSWLGTLGLALGPCPAGRCVLTASFPTTLHCLRIVVCCAALAPCYT